MRFGANAPHWIAGHNAYRDIIRRLDIIEKCSRCGIDDKRLLIVHHKDSNRMNNKPENLEWLCRNCHAMVHSV